MDNLQFIQRLYNGKNCYSDAMTDEQIDLIHIKSGVEVTFSKMIREKRIVFLTGNPGDGKTYIIKSQKALLEGVYAITDLNSVDLNSDQGEVVLENIYTCYKNTEACVIAANEFPFHRLLVKLKDRYPDMYEEINAVRKNILYVGYPTVELKRVCIIDLNVRNLLNDQYCIVNEILNKFAKMLEPYKIANPILHHNIEAILNVNIQRQINEIFRNISMTGRHFVIRDIIGTLSYILVGCTNLDFEGSGFYYDVLFEGSNELMQFAAQFDPALLSCASLDESLWNGNQMEGWVFDVPKKWPVQITQNEGSMDEAIILFRSIKRKFYFENMYAKVLAGLQPLDFNECIEVFKRLKQDTKRIKKMLIGSMNRIFLPTDDEKEKLRIWTTHNYDLSRRAIAAVSTRYVDSIDLDLVYPEPVEWLQDIEYIPSKIIMYYSKKQECRLEIDIEFLRSLIMIKNGYPAVLLSEQYEKVILQFTENLNLAGACKDYGDGEMIICNRRSGASKKIYVEDDKYSLGSEAEY